MHALQEEALGEAGPGGLPLDPVCISPAECGPHGACEAGRCRCVVLYTGVVCGHALVLSPALLAPGLPRFVPAYEGELMLHAQTRHADIRVLRPGPTLEWDLLADAAETAALNRILPPSDLVFKVQGCVCLVEGLGLGGKHEVGRVFCAGELPWRGGPFIPGPPPARTARQAALPFARRRRRISFPSPTSPQTPGAL